MQISPEYFINLVLAISDETVKETIIAKLNEKYQGTKTLEEELEEKPIGELIKNGVLNLTKDAICDLIESGIPVVGGIASKVLKTAFEKMEK